MVMGMTSYLNHLSYEMYIICVSSLFVYSVVAFSMVYLVCPLYACSYGTINVRIIRASKLRPYFNEINFCCCGCLHSLRILPSPSLPSSILPAPSPLFVSLPNYVAIEYRFHFCWGGERFDGNENEHETFMN